MQCDPLHLVCVGDHEAPAKEATSRTVGAESDRCRGPFRGSVAGRRRDRDRRVVGLAAEEGEVEERVAAVNQVVEVPAGPYLRIDNHGRPTGRQT